MSPHASLGQAAQHAASRAAQSQEGARLHSIGMSPGCQPLSARTSLHPPLLLLLRHWHLCLPPRLQPLPTAGRRFTLSACQAVSFAEEYLLGFWSLSQHLSLNFVEKPVLNLLHGIRVGDELIAYTFQAP